MRIGSSSNAYFVNPDLNDWQRVMLVIASVSILRKKSLVLQAALQVVLLVLPVAFFWAQPSVRPFPYLARQSGPLWVVWVLWLADWVVALLVSISPRTFLIP